MANYYFSMSSGNNANSGTDSANAWKTFKGKADGVQFLSSADSCFFLCNDVWFQHSAEIIVNSSGNSLGKIVLTSYGSGQKPLFIGANTVLLGWIATGISNIYALTNQSQTILKTVTQGDTMGLSVWAQGTGNLQPGTFVRSGTTLYVRCWNDEDPSTVTIRVGNYAHSSSFDGARGLICSSRTNGAQGCYIQFENMKIIAANGVGFSSSGSGNYFVNIEAMGCGKEGVLFYSELSGTGEYGGGGRLIDSEVSWCAAAGTGEGQGVSTYASEVWIVDCNIHDNFMAGVDFLDFNANSRVANCGSLRSTYARNGRLKANAAQGYDPNIYIDGGNNIFVYGNICYGVGATAGATNARSSIVWGSETAKQCHDIWVVNNLVYESHYNGVASDNPTISSNNIINCWVVNNTIINYLAGSFEQGWYNQNLEPTSSGHFRLTNNIFIMQSGGTSRASVSVITGNTLYADYNLYYVLNGTNTIYQISGANRSFAQWQAGGYDTNGLNVDPKLTKISDSSPDVHIGSGSQAIQSGTMNSYTPPSWLPADLFPYGGTVRGVSRSDGTVDPATTAMDLGFHYLSGDNFSTSYFSGLTFSNAKMTIERDRKLTMVAA